MNLLKYLNQFTPEGKTVLFNKLIENRTKHFTVVLEDIFQPHNASAVIRSCDCFGIQDIHIIENKHEYLLDPDVTLGSTKWTNLTRYNNKENNTLDCINSLKKQGYKIIATTPHAKGKSIYDIDINDKIALVFGTEQFGVSDTIMEHADEYLTIPMYGFTESYNISVSAAICLYELTKKMHQSDINWQLNEKDKYETLLQWVKNSVKLSSFLEDKFNENLKINN
jgi:tRNA (guanosine-2'-O-)-methyltransferase